MAESEVQQALTAIDEYMAADSRNLRSATINYYNAERTLSNTKYRHDSLYNKLLAEGVLAGSNEQKRYGSFIIDQPDLVAELQNAEEAAIDARRKLEMARIDHSYANKRFQMFQMFAPGIAESVGGMNSLWQESGAEEKKSKKPEQGTQSKGRKKDSA